MDNALTQNIYLATVTQTDNALTLNTYLATVTEIDNALTLNTYLATVTDGQRPDTEHIPGDSHRWTTP